MFLMVEAGFVNSFDPRKSAQKSTPKNPKEDWLEWLCSVIRIIPLDGCIFLPVVMYTSTQIEHHEPDSCMLCTHFSCCSIIDPGRRTNRSVRELAEENKTEFLLIINENRN